MRLLMNVWPPFLGAGIRVKRLQPDWKEVDVEMKLRGWNSNYVGTHYGGSLYSMADPFYMLMLIENVGRNYIVWDKSASIRFKKPEKGIVSGHAAGLAPQNWAQRPRPRPSCRGLRDTRRQAALGAQVAREVTL